MFPLAVWDELMMCGVKPSALSTPCDLQQDPGFSLKCRTGPEFVHHKVNWDEKSPMNFSKQLGEIGQCSLCTK